MPLFPVQNLQEMMRLFLSPLSQTVCKPAPILRLSLVSVCSSPLSDPPRSTSPPSWKINQLYFKKVLMKSRQEWKSGWNKCAGHVDAEERLMWKNMYFTSYNAEHFIVLLYHVHVGRQGNVSERHGKRLERTWFMLSWPLSNAWRKPIFPWKKPRWLVSVEACWWLWQTGIPSERLAWRPIGMLCLTTKRYHIISFSNMDEKDNKSWNNKIKSTKLKWNVKIIT